MKNIRTQVQSAKRRLVSERFLRMLPWNLMALLTVALIGLSLPLFMVLPLDKTTWYASWVGAAVVLSLLINSVMTWLGRPSVADAAVEVDRRFGLRERLSSALMLAPEDRETELGKALMADAEKRAEAIDVRDQFHWGMHRGLLLPVVPSLMILALWFAPWRSTEGDSAIDGRTTINPIANSTKPLIEQLKKKREEAEKQGLEEAADLFKQVESELAKLQKDNKLDAKQSLAKLNDIKEQLEKRRSELGGSESLKKNLQGIEKFEEGPAEKLAEAMKKGDFDKANAEAQKLLEKMNSGEGLDQKDMEKLQKQLEQLEKALSEAAQSHEMAKQTLEKQMKQAEAAGDLQKAAQLERKLAEMQAQDAQMEKMMQMADALSQCKECMAKGDKQGAKDAMEKMASQLQKMSEQNGEMQDLDQLMDSLSESKSKATCKNCQGDGCSKCMSSGMMSQFGKGMGEGKGSGDRPEEESETDFFESRVRDEMKPGETVFGGKVGGENRKGITRAEIQSAIQSSATEDPEPVENQALPRAQQAHTREYFNSLREGK